jgi:hypothetical protein
LLDLTVFTLAPFRCPNHNHNHNCQDSLAYNDMLRTSGHFIAAHALQSVRTATTVRVRGGQVLVTDGPFAETKEQLLGFVLIEAKDHYEAVEVASRIPLAHLGSIEVRAIMDLAR